MHWTITTISKCWQFPISLLIFSESLVSARQTVRMLSFLLLLIHWGSFIQQRLCAWLILIPLLSSFLSSISLQLAICLCDCAPAEQGPAAPWLASQTLWSSSAERTDLHFAEGRCSFALLRFTSVHHVSTELRSCKLLLDSHLRACAWVVAVYGHDVNFKMGF